MHPMTETLLTALAAAERAVDAYVEVALLPLDAMDRAEWSRIVGVALDDANAADAVVEALLGPLHTTRPRGSMNALADAERAAWARVNTLAERTLARNLDAAERRALDRAMRVALFAWQQADRRHAIICGWLADAVLKRYEAHDAAA